MEEVNALEEKYLFGWAYTNKYHTIQWKVTPEAEKVLERMYQKGVQVQSNRQSAAMMVEAIKKELSVEHWVDWYVVGAWLTNHLKKIKNQNDPSYIRKKAMDEKENELLEIFWDCNPTSCTAEELKERLKEANSTPNETNMRVVAVSLGFLEFAISDNSEAKRANAKELKRCKDANFGKNHHDVVAATQEKKRLKPAMPSRRSDLLFMVELLLFVKFCHRHSRGSLVLSRKRKRRNDAPMTFDTARPLLNVFLDQVKGAVADAGSAAVLAMESE